MNVVFTLFVEKVAVKSETRLAGEEVAAVPVHLAVCFPAGRDTHQRPGHP